MPLDDPLMYTLIAAVIVLACIVIVYAVKKGVRRKKAPEEKKPHLNLAGLPFKVTKSISPDDAGHAKGELRTLELEREILSDAIRRLYEAHAEGKITEEERERLAQTYKTRMMTVKEAISKDESVVALHELEAMQEDLIKLFSDRFDELSGKIEELRQRADVNPVKETTASASKTPPPAEEKASDEEKGKRKRKPPSSKPIPKTEAEKRIEEIRNEVEKVLDRLGQMEVES